MYSGIVKLIGLAALLLAAFVKLRGASQMVRLPAVCGGALFVMMETVRSRRYLWVAAFAVLICFNPVFPLVPSRPAPFGMVILSALGVLASLRCLRPSPRMSLATITDLAARGESL